MEGGTLGLVGASGQGMNQAYLKMRQCFFYGNTASGGHNNIAEDDRGTSLGGVVFVGDSSCH